MKTGLIAQFYHSVPGKQLMYKYLLLFFEINLHKLDFNVGFLLYELSIIELELYFNVRIFERIEFSSL